MTLLLALALFASPLLADSTGEWRSYGATAASTKYAPFDQIDATNFDQLEIAWTWASADQPILDAHPEIWTMVFEGTPLQVGDKLYVSTSLNLVVALDATSGKTIWTYDPGTWRSGTPANVGLVHREASPIGKTATTVALSLAPAMPISSPSTPIPANPSRALATTAAWI